MDQIKAYRQYWLMHPPTHLLVAGFLQYKPSLDMGKMPAMPDLPEFED